jgi:ABC-2 type transport system permease protein
MSRKFSWERLWAMIRKEFIQMRRDRLTFAMLIGIPLIQLILFGYAINTNPKHLPTAVLLNDHSPYTRAFIQGLKNTDYFRITKEISSEKAATESLAKGEVLFLVTIPTDFTRRLIRGERPNILVDVDATDPIATSNAIAAINTLAQTIFDDTLPGSLKFLAGSPASANAIVHAKYNPEANTQYNVVPGLLGVVLTMTMVVVTSLAITRERERGTMENLLATPVQPIEVMIGKITPYIAVGYVQIILIIIAACFLFGVPVQGSLVLLFISALPYIAANLSVGLMFSSLASNQLQAMQMAFFFFLPSIMLSGFIFPFSGMPQWAQWLGNVFPLTFFLRIVRGIMLKGNGIVEIWPNIWPIVLFTLVSLYYGIKRYRKTLD